MNIVNQLDAVRTAASGCSLVAFGDLRTRLVLRVSAETPWPQERLDELCAQGADCFAKADGTVLQEHFGGPGGTGRSHRAIVLGPSDIRLFLRAENDETDMVCCICRSPADLAAVESAARAALSAF